jgi:hypothetical protein
LAHAIDLTANCGVGDRVLEQAIAERIEAVAALRAAIEKEPRGFQ